jgi:hypothetical protein
MQLEPIRTRPRPARRPWLGVLSAVLELAQGKGELVRHAERPWASVTFAGTRHSVVLAFSGAEAVAAGEDFIACLPDHEFAIPGQLVADACIVRVDHATLPDTRLECEVELLLLEEG